MKTINLNLYKFDELSEESKQNVLENLYDINVNYDWWEFTYQDAKNVSISIEGFDLYRRDITVNLLCDAYTTANEIMEQHGENCKTYKIASSFISEWDALVEKYSDGKTLDRVSEDNEYDFDVEAEELEKEFKHDVAQEYLSILDQEYEYLTSEEVIIEAIEANEYDFTEDGKIY